ncbi:DUF4962 domain-containing protein [Duganella sp. CY15W]|uniref:heparinase II/III domain-containing protein n=1 Tax=Duganella sp. CY15W TaxID=2692172 RepID=UPI001370C13F|nr:heparinase II/III family protein [Duganella sp. CY15W]MYM32534.1 DUF4962 domain-containing protein [Duganella sp. CY15W]
MLKSKLGRLSVPMMLVLSAYNLPAAAGPVATPLACTPTNLTSEWPQTSPFYRSLQPIDCAVIEHDPPVLAWSNVNGATGYEVKVSRANDATFSILNPLTTTASATPWLYYPTKLGAGYYTWNVRVKGATAWGPSRRFQISSGAADFSVPSVDTAFARASALARPRAQPVGAERSAWLADLRTGSRAADYSGLRKRVTAKLTEVMPLDPASKSAVAGYATAAIATANLAYMNQMVKLAEGAREASLVASLEREPAVLADARRRVLFMARLDPNGSTSWATETLSAFRLVWTMAVCYDWLYADFTAAERAEIEASVAARVAPMLASLTDIKEGLAAKPLDSFAIDTLQATVSIAALMAGNVADAKNWFAASYPLFPQWLSPWGGDDGGFAGGTNYSIWALESAEIWDIIRWTTGMDITHKTWTRNFGRQLVYFYPPGSPFGIFGDGAEGDNTEANGRLFRPYAARINDPLYNWYNTQWVGGDYSRLQAILAPVFTRQTSLPAGTPNSIYLPSVGWTAMHSDLADRARTSVYFKSSNYGSYGHAHADQNTFVLNSKGRALLVETGVYDYYGSYNYVNWLKTTAAHNGITYNGGIGQGNSSNGRGDVTSTGNVTAFKSTAAVDIVTGDASKAYSSAVVANSPVTTATRTLVYIRPSTVLVFDTLSAKTAVTWEWNVHGQVAPTASDNSSFTIKNVDATACGKVSGETPLVLKPITAPSGAAVAGQWHGRYAMATPALNTTFAAVMSVDCATALPTAARKSDGSWVVTGPTWTVTYAAGKATYNPR